MSKIVQQTDHFPSGLSGAIVIPATAPGNVLVILAVSSAGNGAKWTAPNFISTSDGIFTEVPFYSLQAGALWDWGSFAGSGTSSDILHQITTGGVTVVNYNTNIQADMICVREVSGLVTPVVVDDFKMNGSASGLVVGSALTGIGINDLCFENFATFNYNIAGSLPRNPWMNDLGLSDNGGSGALLQLNVPGTQPAPAPVDSSGNPAIDQYTCTAVAFKGMGSPPTTPVDENGNPVTLKYAFDDNFNLIVGRFVDTNNNIHSFPFLYSNDHTGKFDPFAANDRPGGGFGCPWGFTCLSDRLFYVADQCTGIFWEVDIVTGICTIIAGGGNGSGFPNEIATNWNFGFQSYTIKAGLDGNLYLAVPGYETIICVNMQNHPINVCGVAIPVGFAAEVAGFDVNGGIWRSDYSVAVDALGNVYAGEEGDAVGNGNKVWKTDPAGVTTLIAGTGTVGNTGDGGPANLAELDAPLGLAIDTNNILYIACNGNGDNGQIRAINLSGTVQNVCGKTIAPGNIDTLYNPGATQSNFWACQPDYQGNLLVCDIHGSGACPSSHAWMHQIDAAGVYSLIAGSATGVCGFSGNGGPPLAALIGVAFGAAVPLPVTGGHIIVTKATVPFSDGVDYTFRPSWGAPFSLIDGGSHDGGPLAPGVYSVTEDPTAGTLTTIDVSNGDPATAINLGAGETVTVAFLNSTTAPAPPGGTSFVKRKAPVPGTIQVVPLDNSPNQVWGVTVKVDDQSIPLRITLRYNELAKYWIATIKDKKGNVLLDSLPFITGTGISQNLLGQFVHLALGSATVFNASSLASDRPNNQNLGKDFLLIWGDTPAEESDVVTRLVVPVTFPPGGETPPPPPPPPPPGPPSPVPGDVDVLDYCINSQAATMHLTGFALNGNPANSYSFIDPPTHSFAFIKSNAGWADDILLYYADRIDQFITEMDDADHRLWSDNRAYKRLRKSLPVMPRFITPGAIPTVFDLPKPNQYDRLINCLVIDTKDKGDVTNFTYPPVIMNLDSWGAGGGNIGPVSVIVNERYSGKFARERFYLGLHLGLMYWDAASLTSGLKFTGTYTVSNWAAHNKLVAGGGVGSSFGCGYGVGWP